VGRRYVPHVEQVCERLGFQTEPLDIDRRKVHVEIQGDAHNPSSSSRAARHRCSGCPRDRVARASPHLTGDRPRFLPEARGPSRAGRSETTCRFFLKGGRYRYSGPGGTVGHTTIRACAVTHRPSGRVNRCRTGISPSCRTARKAMRVLSAGMFMSARRRAEAELARRRRLEVGTGDRAEKIRTYKYGERRGVTRSRIKLTVAQPRPDPRGELDELTAGPARAMRAERRLQEPG